MIKYAIPGMYELRQFNIDFIEFKRKNPEFFYEDVEIDVVYGNPQFCIWDGGRIFTSYEHTTIETLDALYKHYNDKLNLPIRYVFTNAILEKDKHYNDHFGHILMKMADNGKNQVVVADDNFCKFLQEKYPNFKYVSSTTKCLTDKELVKKELHKNQYDMICLDYNLNKNFKFLESFTEEEKKKTEFLINPICAPMCPHRKEHYYLNSISHLNYGRKYNMKHCYIVEDIFYPDEKAHGNNISYEQIKNIYAPMGFEYFKIEGRTWSPGTALLTYVEYMVKPEYKNHVIASFISRMM